MVVQSAWLPAGAENRRRDAIDIVRLPELLGKRELIASTAGPSRVQLGPAIAREFQLCREAARETAGEKECKARGFAALRGKLN
jgi:hypothetical protein